MRRTTCRKQFQNGAQKKVPESAGLVRGFRAKFGPDLIFKSGQKHQKLSEMSPESTVWAETWSRSMPGPFRSVWDGSNPLRGAVPGEKCLVLEVQVPPKMSGRAQIIENGPNGVQNRPFGLKLGPEACQDRSPAFGMGLTHSKGPSPAKKVKKCAEPPQD